MERARGTERLKQVRHLWVVTHRWVGIILFIPLIILGITGSFLVWPEASERLFHPNRYDVAKDYTELPLTNYIEAGLTALPEGDRVSAIRMPEYPGQAVLVGGKPSATSRVGPPARYRVWLDPATAQPVATWGLAPDGMWYMHALHGHLATPGLGRPIVGFLGFFLTFSCLTGIWIWWPRNAGFMKGLRWRRSPDFNTNLHYLGGIWSAIPLAIVAFTGAWIVFPNSLGAPVAFFAGEATPTDAGRGHEQAPPPAPPLASANLSPDEAVALVRAEVGHNAPLAFISMPSEANASWMVSVACGGVPDCHGGFVINDATQKISAIEHHEPSAADSAAEEMELIHLGGTWTPLWRIVVFVTGLLPAIFGVTGIVMWLSRTARKRKLKVGATVAETV